MNAEPYIPLPKQNKNKPIVSTQLMMLWLIWLSGLIAGLLIFFGEVMAMKLGNQSMHDPSVYPMNEMAGAMSSSLNENKNDDDDGLIASID